MRASWTGWWPSSWGFPWKSAPSIICTWPGCIQPQHRVGDGQDLCLEHTLPIQLPPLCLSTHGSPASVHSGTSSVVPWVYHELGAVFVKQRTLPLPPHRPYDCTIDLLPCAPLPRSRLFNLSRPEQEAMEGYIRDSLAAGLIRPSSSPVGAGFFFVAKKDKTLHPCIDYRRFNITVKNKYSQPLINSGFVPLQGANIFTRLELSQCVSFGAHR